MVDVTCSDCGTLIPDEDGSSMPSSQEKKPCPKCGSTQRTVSVSVRVTITLSDSVSATVTHYSQILMKNARSLFDAGDHGLAIVVAHTAYEVGVERALSQVYRRRQIGDLEEALDAMLGNFNIGNDRVRKFFTALSGENVTDEPFWQGIKPSAERRNKIVHGGMKISKAEAEESLNACSGLVDWLVQKFE